MLQKFYSLDNINSKDATYNMIIGQRSNGKSYAALLQGLKNYARTGEQMALIRRYREDFIGKRGQVMFDALLNNDEVKKATKGMWSGIFYQSSKWYFCKDIDGVLLKADEPFCYGFALSEMEHDKSTSYPKITTIVFDEFISRVGYLKDEFVIFCNVISTIIRHRTNVKIYMLGNTVNKYCPYFDEMGLTHVKSMKPGTIEVYTYGNSELRVAVEYCHNLKAGSKKKTNDYYFAFDNPKLKMITNGAWEIDIYPHLMIKYKPKDVLFQYFIDFNGEILHCEIIHADNCLFTYIHRKTTPIQDLKKDLIYTTENRPEPNIRRNMLKPTDMIDKKVAKFFSDYKVFYQSNDVGEVMRNYLLWCMSK